MIVGNPLSLKREDNLNPPPSKDTTIKYDEIFPLENAKVNCYNETTDHYYYDFQNLTGGKIGQCKNGYVQLTHLEYEELQRRDNFFTWDIAIINELNKQSDIEFNNKCKNWRTRSYSNIKSKKFDGYYKGISKDTYISACVSDHVIGFFHDRNVTGKIKKGGKFSVVVGDLRSVGKTQVALLMMGGKIKDNIILIEGLSEEVFERSRGYTQNEDRSPNDAGGNRNEDQEGQDQEGMYVEQDGQMVWVQHQSGYEKFKSKWCAGCSQIYTHMVNRANTRKSQGAALSGFDKYILKVESFRY